MLNGKQNGFWLASIQTTSIFLANGHVFGTQTNDGIVIERMWSRVNLQRKMVTEIYVCI